MRTRIGWFLLAFALWLAPGSVSAQYYEVPPKAFTGPLSHPRYENGGLFIAFDAVVWHMDRRIRNQTVAQRGFVDLDGSVTGQPPPVPVGTFEEALNTEMLRGPGSWTPGFNFNIGWRFESGVVLTASWLHMTDTRYAVSAGPIGPNFQVGGSLENSFLFSPVTNFSPDYAGPRDIPQSTPPDPVNDATATALYGVWNGADNMSIELLQRFDMVTISGRIPVWDSEYCRTYGLIGPRIITMYERFKWRTVDLDQFGNGTSINNVRYTNTVSNRLYGVHIGCGQEWFLGDVPILGGFSFSLDAEGSIYGDWVKGRAKYAREDGGTAASRARNFFQAAPGVECKASLWWYPWEAVQVRIGYDFMAIFNTMASERPIDFNMGIISPVYNSTNRVFHGFFIGGGVVF